MAAEHRFLPERFVLVFFGLTASGKSYLAQAFSKANHLPYYNTDRERKLIAGLAPTDNRPDDVGKGIYSKDLTRKTYNRLLNKAADELTRHRGPVLLDGSYSKRSDREAVAEMAGRHKAEVLFVFCTCSEQEVGRRFRLRERDPEAVSDGRWEIYRYQQTTFEMPFGSDEPGRVLVLNTEGRLEDLVETVGATVMEMAEKKG